MSTCGESIHGLGPGPDLVRRISKVSVRTRAQHTECNMDAGALIDIMIRGANNYVIQNNSGYLGDLGPRRSRQ